MAPMDKIPGCAYVRHMSDFTALHAELTGLFEAHGLMPELRGDWLTVAGLCPAIRAHIAGRLLYVELALTQDKDLTELYPAKDGLAAFRDGIFPVLLSAFWQRHNPGQVTRQVIKRPDGPWQVFVGRYLRQVDKGERPPLPYLLYETIDDFLRQQSLDADAHWLSIGVAVDADGPSADIKLDGVRQPALESHICDLDWIYDGRDYTLRNASLVVRG